MVNWSSEFTHVTAAIRAVADVILILITGSSWVPDQGAVERCTGGHREHSGQSGQSGHSAAAQVGRVTIGGH